MHKPAWRKHVAQRFFWQRRTASQRPGQDGLAPTNCPMAARLADSAAAHVPGVEPGELAGRSPARAVRRGRPVRVGCRAGCLPDHLRRRSMGEVVSETLAPQSMLLRDSHEACGPAPRGWSRRAVGDGETTVPAARTGHNDSHAAVQVIHLVVGRSFRSRGRRGPGRIAR